MYFPIRNLVLLGLSGILASSMGCHKVKFLSDPAAATIPTPKAANSTPIIAKEKVQKTAPRVDEYAKAIDIAEGANVIHQSATSQDDWKLVSNQWKEAIQSLNKVPASSSNYSKAQKKIGEYKNYLAAAESKSLPTITESKFVAATDEICKSNINPQSFSIPIKYRSGGTPVVEVTFNGSTYEMLFDTGASITLVTSRMAYDLRLIPEHPKRDINAGIADGSVITLPIAFVRSQKIDSYLKRNLKVAIAPASLTIGLLGQNSYSGYNVTVKKDAIEFYRRPNLGYTAPEKISKNIGNCWYDGDSNPEFFTIPIKKRVSDIPVVTVTFNNQEKFDMLFDTGASGTLITASMAKKLGLRSLGLTSAGIANGSVVVFETTILKSMQIKNRIKRDLRVAVVSGSDIGLLGQDFFEGYDFTIKEDVVEFRRR